MLNSINKLRFGDDHLVTSVFFPLNVFWPIIIEAKINWDFGKGHKLGTLLG